MQRQLSNDEAGFSMLELLVAFVLFSLVATSLTSAFIHMMRTNTNSEIQSGAVLAVQRKLDELRLMDPSSMPESGTDEAETITVGGRDYSISVEYCPTGTAYCTGDSVRHIKAIAEYNGKNLYTVETVYAQLQ